MARAEQEAAEAKLRRVGANQVVSPYVIGGHRIAQAVLRPTVGALPGTGTRLNAADYKIEEVAIAKASPLCGKTLREANWRDDLGVVVIAIRSPDGEIVFNPKGDTVIETGCIVVVVGRREQLDELEEVATGHSHPKPAIDQPANRPRSVAKFTGSISLPSSSSFGVSRIIGVF